MKRVSLLFLIIIISLNIFAQHIDNIEQDNYHKKMEWFKDAKLGIFIHWGIYAVDGISESWSFFNGYISHEDYVKQANGFTAINYDPDYWAKIIQESGAKYSVITTKHHDGFALWDTKYENFNAVDNSPAKRDLISPFVKALRKNDLKVGLYYSLPDWSSEKYTDHTREIKRYKIADDPKRWAGFLKYNQGQLKELKENFDPDLWWFDGDWEHNAEEWKAEETRSFLKEDNPEVIINSRLCGNGDYETPEIGIPVYKPKADYWELCIPMNDSWGYQHVDKNYKSPQQIMDLFVDCISKGGNLLLDIGPTADGTIPDEQVHILKELGKWTTKHKEAVYDTREGIPYQNFYGPSALSKDSTVLYLYIRDKPKDGKVVLKGIKNDINRIYVVGNGTVVNHKVFSKIYWSDYPGITYIELPENVLDEYYTVLAVMLDDKIKLYNKNSGAIESN